MMKSVKDKLEDNLRFLKRVSVLQNLPEPKEHVLSKISDLVKIVSKTIMRIATNACRFLKNITLTKAQYILRTFIIL